MATFDTKRGRYIVDGRILALDEVRAEIKRIETFFQRTSRAISKQLFRREISIADWQIQMRDLIKSSHVISASIGYGGKAQMTPGRWGKVGVTLREEYKALNNFARQIEQGKVIFESQYTQRAQKYGSSFRKSYFIGEKAVQAIAGHTLCGRVIHSREQCRGCLFWHNKGFVPIDEQPDIGTLNCGGFCLCTFEYR